MIPSSLVSPVDRRGIFDCAMDMSPADAQLHQRRFDFVPAKRRRVQGVEPQQSAPSAGTPPGAAAASLRRHHQQVVDRLAQERTLLLLRHGATLCAAREADEDMAEAAAGGYGSLSIGSMRGVGAGPSSVAAAAGAAIIAGGSGCARGGHGDDTCHICRAAACNTHGTALPAPCAHCAKTSCAACQNPCEGCGAAFCKFCSTCDYSTRLERWFCLDCAAHHRPG